MRCCVLLLVGLIGSAALAAPPRKSAVGEVKQGAPVADRKGGCSDAADGSSLNMSRDHDEKNRPRWSCPATEITVPPVWHGDRVECSFEIKNEGTGPLNIKARGG